MLRLDVQEVSEWVHAEAGSGRILRASSGVPHSQRLQQVCAYYLTPRLATQPPDQLAQHGIADVRVVEPGAGSELERRLARHQLGPGPAGGPLPPGPVGLGLQA